MDEHRSIFFDEWQKCLHAHYLYVLRTGDAVTEPTLRHVLLATGLPPDELAVIQAQATRPGDPPAGSADDPGRPEPPPDGQLSLF